MAASPRTVATAMITMYLSVTLWSDLWTGSLYHIDEIMQLTEIIK
jgi:hypothetical protein